MVLINMHAYILVYYIQFTVYTQVISYVHGLPDETWPEGDPDDPLSLVDQVLISI